MRLDMNLFCRFFNRIPVSYTHLSQHLRTGNLTDAEWESLIESAGVIGKSNLIIDDTPGIKMCIRDSFTHEEQLMEKMGYGGIEEQKKQHRMFVQKLEEFTDRVSKLSLGTQDAMIQDLFEYLQQWLQDHIKVEDMKYARFAMEKTKGDC